MTLNINDAINLSKELAKATSLLPKHAKTAPEILAIILAGDELGWGPMASLRSLQFVSGKVTLTADSMLGLVAKAGITIAWSKDGSDGAAELTLKRNGVTHVQKFTTEDQKRAGLNSDTWKKYGPAMLRARCVSAAVRAFCPDVLCGAYLPGELPDDDRKEGASELSAGAKEVIDLAAAQGFVPASDAAVSPEVVHDLGELESQDELAKWMAGQLQKKLSKADKASVWDAFKRRCNEVGVDADAALAEAKSHA